MRIARHKSSGTYLALKILKKVHPRHETGVRTRTHPAAPTRLSPDVPLPVRSVLQSEIIRLKQVDHIMSEKDILQRINHPMIIMLCAPLSARRASSPFREGTGRLALTLRLCVAHSWGTSQDDFHLYMYMEFVSGGELFSHLRRAGRFTNDTGKFFAASIVLALQHLHALDIVYRDLKVREIWSVRFGGAVQRGQQCCFCSCCCLSHTPPRVGRH